MPHHGTVSQSIIRCAVSPSVLHGTLEVEPPRFPCARPICKCVCPVVRIANRALAILPPDQGPWRTTFISCLSGSSEQLSADSADILQISFLPRTADRVNSSLCVRTHCSAPTVTNKKPHVHFTQTPNVCSLPPHPGFSMTHSVLLFNSHKHRLMLQPTHQPFLAYDPSLRSSSISLTLSSVCDVILSCAAVLSMRITDFLAHSNIPPS